MMVRSGAPGLCLEDPKRGEIQSATGPSLLTSDNAAAKPAATGVVAFGAGVFSGSAKPRLAASREINTVFTRRPVLAGSGNRSQGKKQLEREDIADGWQPGGCLAEGRDQGPFFVLLDYLDKELVF